MVRLAGALLARAMLVILLGLGAALPARAQDVGLPIGTVPDAVELEDLDGNAVNLGAITRGRPAIIQFWATWCPICSQLQPSFQAVRRQHGDAVDIIYVAVGVNQNPRTIRRHLESHPLAGRVLYDARGRATRAFRAPTTSYVVALDATGRVVYTGVGGEQDIASAAARAVGR
ncbi:MAG TPA: TlpA disulfide reductase family protein [Longimicrobiales bacterium]|nr:TlpA disulfide reductase family protein [Longimicrobiales bacterium]